MKKGILVFCLLALALLLTGCSCKHENIQLTGAREADCVEQGYTGDHICTACNEVIVTGTVIPALGHVRSEAVFAMESTCRLQGYSGDVYCLRCLSLLQAGEALPLGDHVAKEPSRTEPTCERRGYIDATLCRDCNTVLAEEVSLPALGHSIPDLEGDIAPTCTEKGFSGKGWCETCGEYVKGKSISAIPHDYDHGLCTVCAHQQPGLFDANYELKMTWDELVSAELLQLGDVYSGDRHKFVKAVSDQLTGILVLPAEYDIILYSKFYWGDLVNQGMECNLTRIVLPKERSDIGHTCLNGLAKLEAIEITGPVKSIETNAFSNCTSLKEIILPETLTHLQDATFMGDSALESITLPAGLIQIGDRCFADCTALKEIVLPATVKRIYQAAFTGCTSLERVVVSGAIEKSYSPLFDNCPALKEIVFAKDCNKNSLKLFAQVNEGAYAIFYEGTEEAWNALGGSEYFPNASVTFNYIGE